MRLFVSVDFPSALTEAVESVQAEFADADGIRLTDPTQTHITLKFLGDVPESDLPQVRELLTESVAAADLVSFPVTIAEVGAFPSHEYISVVWVGVETGSEELTRLHEELEARAVTAGFDPADHAFTPHATIARMDHAGGKPLVQRKLTSLSPSLGQFEVNDVRLTESTLTSSGPEYTTVERVPLDA